MHKKWTKTESTIASFMTKRKKKVSPRVKVKRKIYVLDTGERFCTFILFPRFGNCFHFFSDCADKEHLAQK